MKKTSLLLLPLLLFSSVGRLHSQISEEPHIVVTGTVSESLPPDLMRWRLEITSKRRLARELADPHSTTVKQVLALLREAGVDQKDIGTSRMRLEEHRVWEDGASRFRGYYAKTNIKFETSQLDLYDSLWMGLSEIDGVSIEGVSLDLENYISIRKRLRVQALEAAKEKAKEMAEVLGEELAGVLYIAEDEKRSDGPSVGGNLSLLNSEITSDDDFVAVGGMGAETALSVGQIPLRARVLVAFRLSGKSHPPN